MARLARSSVLIAFLPIAFCRLGYDVRPTQTNYAADKFDFEWGWSPVPTAMPNVFDKLSRRQGIAPNATCGFFSDGGVLTCYNGLYCGFNSGYTAAGCCYGYELVGSAYTLTNCDFFTTCYDSTAVAANCDLACQLNTHNLICEQSSLPYCVTWSFTDIGVSSPCFNGSLRLAVVSTNCVFKYTNLGCWGSSGFAEDLALTYNAPTTTTSVATTSGITSTTTPSTTSSISSAVTTSTASTGSSAGGSGTVAVTTTPSGTGGFSGSKSGSSSGSSSSNTGAIAGGVVGGVVGLAIIAGLIWFFMRCRKKNSTGPPTPEVSQHTSMQYPYSPVSPNTQGPSRYGSPTQVHEFPPAAVGGAYNHPMDHPQRDYQLGQYGQAHEISSEGTSSSRPLNPGYSNAPEVVQQGGYRGVDPTGRGYGNPNASYGAEPEHYGRPYGETP